jgi:hypothetical protein
MPNRETWTVALIFIVIAVICTGLIVAATREAQSIKNDLAKIGGSELNPAGQFVEAVNCDDVPAWFATHKGDRRVVAITGVGRGAYGVDVSFIVVSEPARSPAEKRSE